MRLSIFTMPLCMLSVLAQPAAPTTSSEVNIAETEGGLPDPLRRQYKIKDKWAYNDACKVECACDVDGGDYCEYSFTSMYPQML